MRIRRILSIEDVLLVIMYWVRPIKDMTCFMLKRSIRMRSIDVL